MMTKTREIAKKKKKIWSITKCNITKYNVANDNSYDLENANEIMSSGKNTRPKFGCSIMTLTVLKVWDTS